MESNVADKPVPREIDALLSDERLILRETQRAVTPFGGIAVFISFLDKIGFVEAVRQHMPIRWRSPNYIDPTSRLVKKLTRRDSNISVSRRVVLCRVLAHRQFAVGLALGTEARYPSLGEDVRHDNARRSLSRHDATRLHQTE